MNIKNKKTALDDSASLYEQNRDYSSKDNLKNLTGKQKWRYFLDYYWKQLLVIILIAAFVLNLLNTMIFNRSECLLSLITTNECNIERSEELSETLQDYLSLENKNDYVSVEYFDTENAQMNMAYTARIAANSADIIVCSYEDFVQTAQQGVFVNLKETLPEETYNQLLDNLLEEQIIETDIDGNEISRGELAPYGIDISNSAVYKEFGGTGERVILGISVGSPNPENAWKAITYLTGIE